MNEFAPKNDNPLDEIPKTVSDETGFHYRGMGTAAFAVRYPVTVSMFFIGIIMLGWISLTKLPTNLFPDLRTPPCNRLRKCSRPVSTGNRADCY